MITALKVISCHWAKDGTDSANAKSHSNKPRVEQYVLLMRLKSIHDIMCVYIEILKRECDHRKQGGSYKNGPKTGNSFYEYLNTWWQLYIPCWKDQHIITSPGLNQSGPALKWKFVIQQVYHIAVVLRSKVQHIIPCMLRYTISSSNDKSACFYLNLFEYIWVSVNN